MQSLPSTITATTTPSITAPKPATAPSTSSSAMTQGNVRMHNSNTTNHLPWLDNSDNSTFRDMMATDQSRLLMEYQRDNQYPKVNTTTTSISSQHTIPSHMHPNQLAQMENRSLLQLNTSPVCKYMSVAKRNGAGPNEHASYAIENATAYTADPLNKMSCATVVPTGAAIRRELGGGRCMQSTAMVSVPYSKECKFRLFC